MIVYFAPCLSLPTILRRNGMKAWITAGICACACCVSGYQTFQTKQENGRLLLMNSIYQAEHRIFKNELKENEQKPTYEQGYRDALIRIGGPTQPGAYQDGWDAAMKVVGEGSYANGYHAAIQQFGYQKPDTSRYLIAESLIQPAEFDNRILLEEKKIPTKK